MKSLISLALGLAVMSFTYPAAAQDGGQTPLSLHAVIKTALEKSPAFGASIDRTEAMKAATVKAGALPNPELSIDVENIGGDAPYEGVDAAEITYGVSQLIEMPGKRSGRKGMAEGEERQSTYAHDSIRLDLIRDVVVAYAQTVAATENFKILQQERTLASDVYQSVVAKVDAGKEPPIQKNKAGVALSSSEIALERAKRNMEASQKILANLMGGQVGDVVIIPESLPEMTAPLGLSAYMAMIEASPDIRSYDALVDAAQSGLRYEKANTVPDPTLNFGVRDYRDDNERALVAGLSFPFPVFDMNRAGVRRAGHEYNAAILDKANARLSSEAELIRTYEAFSNAYREHQALNDAVLPGAQEAFDFAREGYAAGKFGYLEVLDAQRTLFDARKQSTQTMLDYYREMAAIDRLTAVHAIAQQEKQ